jgi:hypothetical protein
MIVCQLLVAAGLLCFPAATRGHWGWFALAWGLWIAYAGLNVCLPNLMLKLAPDESNTPYIAAFYAITGLCYAASTIVGGAAVDSLRGLSIPLFHTGVSLDFYSYVFLFGSVARSLGVVLLLMVVEPTAVRRSEA